MPQKDLHKAIETAFGLNSNIGDIMDAPAQWMGKNHRKIFHSRKEVLSLAFLRFLKHKELKQLFQDIITGNLHILLDNLDTNEYVREIKDAKEKRLLKRQFLLSFLKNNKK